MWRLVAVFVFLAVGAGAARPCPTVDGVSTCSDLCRVAGGTRVVFLSGEVLQWSCVASTIEVRTI
jgi:hypothetical protein